MKNGPKKESIKDIQQLHPELKAYIYQQLHEFIPFFMPDSDMEVFVEEKGSKKDKKYVVTLILKGADSSIQSEGKATNVYKATSRAKEKLLHSLKNIQQNLISEQERELEILQKKKKFNIH